jgi:1,2-phenylacetyl-CoA epoxidase catalytic subunit
MPAEYQALLKRVLRIQADCEIGGPHLYVSEWLLAAPSADDQWMLAKVAGEGNRPLPQDQPAAQRAR